MVKASAGLPCTAQWEKAVDRVADRRPDEAQHRADEDDGKSGDDRHRAFAGEKAEIGRELYFVEAIESPGGDQPDDDAAEDAGLDRRNAHDRLHLDAPQFRADAHRGEKDDVTGGAGQRGDAVVFGQADGDADGEEQRQIAEDRVARFRHDERDALGQPREVRAADAEQDAGDRQHRDRQHHALADLLEEREGVLEVEHGGLVFGFGNERADFLGGGAVRARAAARSRQSARLSRRICAFTAGNRRQADAELVHAEADEDRHGVRVAGDAAADADQPLVGVRALDGLRDEAQHRGIQRIDLRRELRVAAIHRERVLREVVGADGEEIGFGGESVRP